MPLLSVVVAITSGADHTFRCLQALSAQRDAPPTEIIVPLYPSLDDAVHLRHEWPSVRFIDIPEEPPAARGWEHMQYDRRRAIGLAASRGEVIAMTEDHAIPEERWSSTIWSLHQRIPYGVIGGGITHRGTNLLNWAVFYCDFARYQPPLPPSTADYISDINVSYKRPALDNCRNVWRDLYDETSVHRSVREAGDTLFLTPDFTVEYDRGPLLLSRVLIERFIWGRVFAGRRAQKVSGLRRFAYISLSPGLAPLLLVRNFFMLRQRGHMLKPYFCVLPLVFLCLFISSLGEFVGYATKRPFPLVAR
jgi:hypothetical protein